jgi:hypothetical protein
MQCKEETGNEGKRACAGVISRVSDTETQGWSGGETFTAGPVQSSRHITKRLQARGTYRYSDLAVSLATGLVSWRVDQQQAPEMPRLPGVY